MFCISLMEKSYFSTKRLRILKTIIQTHTINEEQVTRSCHTNI